MNCDQGRIQSLSLGGRSPCRAPLPSPPHPPFLPSLPPSFHCPFPSLPSLPYPSPPSFPSFSPPSPPLPSLPFRPIEEGVRGSSPGKFWNSWLLQVSFSTFWHAKGGLQMCVFLGCAMNFSWIRRWLRSAKKCLHRLSVSPVPRRVLQVPLTCLVSAVWSWVVSAAQQDFACGPLRQRRKFSKINSKNCSIH